MTHFAPCHTQLRLPLTTILIATLTACSATGPRFVSEPETSDKATVYIFRRKQFRYASGTPEILIGDTSVGKLKNGGYLKVLLDEGSHLIQAAQNQWTWDVYCASTFLDAHQGETHYVELNPNAPITLITVYPTSKKYSTPATKECTLNVLSEEQALPLIQETQLSKQ